MFGNALQFDNLGANPTLTATNYVELQTSVSFVDPAYTNNTITLLDSNQAVLGSITDIGAATLDVTLVASNGAVLNFGRNIIGRGQIQSNNALADAVIVNGDVNGDAISTPLVFTSYVKGVGTFNNIAFSGTFSPGLSPTLLTVGSTVLLPTNVLDMELGGLNRGAVRRLRRIACQHDGTRRHAEVEPDQHL